jgi:hypothetical protein
MSSELAGSADGLARRQSRLLAACVRAAYAWSEREYRSTAMREVARMTGVVMEALGPGREPVSPMRLVCCLRSPLGELVGLLSSGLAGDEIASVVLLDGDRLADGAYDVACEYAQPLAAEAGTAGWLPSWTRMRAEQVEHEAFAQLVEAGDADAYTRDRKFLVSHPAGGKEEISVQRLAASARTPVKYDPLLADQRLTVGSASWWWPCPACRWPMTVVDGDVRCRYRPHRALYQVARGKPGTPPRLLRTDDQAPPPPRARDAATAVRVDSGVWRYIVVPGSTELRIADDLEKAGATVRLWPGKDSYDLHVTAGTLDLRLDVKEYRSVHRLIEDLRARPPRAAILLPRHCEHQADLITRALPSLTLWTEAALRRKVRQAVPRRTP